MFWVGMQWSSSTKSLPLLATAYPGSLYRPSCVENAIKKKSWGKGGGRKVIRSIATKKRTHFHCSLRQVDVLRYFLYSHQAKN